MVGEGYTETGRVLGHSVELECKSCGALVLNIITHNKWHRLMSKRKVTVV